MFTKLIKTSVPSNYFFLPFFIITGWWLFFINAEEIAWVNEKSIIFSLFPLEIFSSVLGNILILVFTVSTALIMIPVTAKYLHNTSGSLLPPVVFLILISQYQWIFHSGPSAISLFFCMLSLRYVFETYHQQRVFHYGFMAGFLTSIATLVYVPSVLFLIICWVGLILLRSFKIREFLIVLVGFMVPLLLTHSVFMISGNEQKLTFIIGELFSKSSVYFNEINQLVGISLIGLLFIWGIMKSVLSGSLKKIVIRRYFEILTIAFLVFATVILFPFRDAGFIAMLILILTFILSMAINAIKKMVYASLLLLLLLLMQIAVQVSIILN